MPLWLCVICRAAPGSQVSIGLPTGPRALAHRPEHLTLGILTLVLWVPTLSHRRCSRGQSEMSLSGLILSLTLRDTPGVPNPSLSRIPDLVIGTAVMLKANTGFPYPPKESCWLTSTSGSKTIHLP